VDKIRRFAFWQKPNLRKCANRAGVFTVFFKMIRLEARILIGRNHAAVSLIKRTAVILNDEKVIVFKALQIENSIVLGVNRVQRNSWKIEKEALT
jgi:hypothetical protein